MSTELKIIKLKRTTQTKSKKRTTKYAKKCLYSNEF